MKPYRELSKEELLALQAELQAEYDAEKEKSLNLDISRGKPGKEQLDLSMPMMDVLNAESVLASENGTDVRNYGVLDGIPEAKELMAGMVGAKPSQMIVLGNSSLNIMYDCVARAEIFGIMGNTPWSKLDKVKFLCPVPGYDRHFGVTEQFGIEMINVPMTEDGPDMDVVEDYVNNDPANLKPAAKDFRIFWDNAYGIHYLYDRPESEQPHILNILEECEKAGNPDIVYEFCSTSKITFPGAGVAAMASSEANIADIKSKLKWQTIGPDKINQLRHVRFFKNIDGINAHMMKQAAIMRPKFEMVEKTLQDELGELGIGSWINPKGGYFICFNTLPGCAKSVVAKAKEAGVALTPAGAPFPYGKDPEDSVIRIAPSFPTMEELETATRIFVLCVKLASVEKLLAE